MSRRGSNIYKRKDGRFEGRIPIGHCENGRLRYKSLYARTLSELKEKMAQFHTIASQRSSVSIRKLTVEIVAEQWLAAAKLRVKPSSYANYENMLQNHILPELGKKYLTDMTAHQLNDFIHVKLQNGRIRGTGGLSPRFVRDMMRVYHSIECYAAQEYGIRETHFTMPKAEKKHLDVLSAEERKKLEQYLMQTDTISNLAVLLCLFTGLRVGEVCGLQWGDIDFSAGILFVRRTVQRIYRKGGSEVVIGSPKSKTSIREVPVPDFLLQLLHPKKRKDHYYLISGIDTPVEPRTMQYRFGQITKRCGIRKIPFHLLRHTYATDCITHGFDAKTLSELLGHADASITLNRYVHSSMQMKQEYVKRLRLTS